MTDYRAVDDSEVHWLTPAQWVSVALLVLGVAALVGTLLLLRTSPEQTLTLPTQSTSVRSTDADVDTVRLFCGPVTAGSGLDDEGRDVADQYGADDQGTVNEAPIRVVTDPDDGSLQPYTLSDSAAAAACSRARDARIGHAVETGLLAVVLLGGSATVAVRRRLSATG